MKTILSVLVLLSVTSYAQADAAPECLRGAQLVTLVGNEQEPILVQISEVLCDPSSSCNYGNLKAALNGVEVLGRFWREKNGELTFYVVQSGDPGSNEASWLEFRFETAGLQAEQVVTSPSNDPDQDFRRIYLPVTIFKSNIDRGC